MSYFEGNITDKGQTGILFSAQDYIQWSITRGKIIRSDKRGAISEHLPPILQRLNLNGKELPNNATQLNRRFIACLGEKGRILPTLDKQSSSTSHFLVAF